jgi:hypothetical protein
MRAIEQAVRHFQQPEVQDYPRNLQQPAVQEYKNLRLLKVQEYLSSLLSFQDITRQQMTISKFRLPPAVFRVLAVAVNENSIQAVVEAANSAYATQLRSAAENPARSLNVDLSTEALASAQYAAVQRFLKTSLSEVTREISQSTVADAQARYAESLRELRSYSRTPT